MRKVQKALPVTMPVGTRIAVTNSKVQKKKKLSSTQRKRKLPTSDEEKRLIKRKSLDSENCIFCEKGHELGKLSSV